MRDDTDGPRAKHAPGRFLFFYPFLGIAGSVFVGAVIAASALAYTGASGER